MTKQQKQDLAIAKLKEMKLLASEVNELLEGNDADEKLDDFCESGAMQNYMQELYDYLWFIDTKTENGIKAISNYEKQRRIDYGNRTKESNIARRRYYENERCCGEVGKLRKSVYRN